MAVLYLSRNLSLGLKADQLSAMRVSQQYCDMYDNVRRRPVPDTIVADEQEQANDSTIIQTFHLFILYKNLECR